MLAVDDVAAGRQVVEEAVDRARPGAGLAVGPRTAVTSDSASTATRLPGSTKPRSTAATTIRAPATAEVVGRARRTGHQQALLGQEAATGARRRPAVEVHRTTA